MTIPLVSLSLLLFISISTFPTPIQAQPPPPPPPIELTPEMKKQVQDILDAALKNEADKTRDIIIGLITERWKEEWNNNKDTLVADGLNFVLEQVKVHFPSMLKDATGLSVQGFIGLIIGIIFASIIITVIVVLVLFYFCGCLPGSGGVAPASAVPSFINLIPPTPPGRMGTGGSRGRMY